MTPEQQEQAIKISMDMKKAIRKQIDRNSTKISKLNPNYADPHTAIIGCAQMALAQASTEYLMKCGCSTPEAVQAMTQVTQAAMTRWLASLMKPVQGNGP